MAVVVAALLLVSERAAHARATESQRNYNTGTGSVVGRWRSAVTAGRLLIAGVTFTGGTDTTITAPAGWQPVNTTYRSDNGTTLGVAVYYIANTAAKAAGTLETFTFSSPTAVGTIQMTEVAGIIASNPVDPDTIATAAGTGTSIVLTAPTAADETSEYGYALVATTSQAANFGNGTNGFARTSSYLYNTNTTATNLDAGTSHRTNMESTLMMSAAGSALSTTITSPNAPYAGIMVGFKVQALYWIGAGSYPARPVNPSPPVAGVCYGYFDDDACWANSSGGVWSGTASPGGNDVVVFDAGGLGDCTMSPWAPGTEQAYSIEVRSGYLGAISKVTSDLQLQRHFTLNAGTFNGAAGLTFRTNQSGTYVGDMDIAGGTLNGNGMAFTVRNLYVESGTLDAGSATFATTNNGIVNIAGGTARFPGGLTTVGSVTMTGGNLIGVTGNIAITGAANFTNASVTTGAGVFSTTGNLTMIGSTLTGSTGNITIGGTANLSSSSTLTAGTGALSTSGTLTVNASTVTGGGAGTTIGNALSMTSASLTAGAGAFSVTGSATLNTSSTLDVSAASSRAFNTNTSVLTGSTLTLGAGTSTMTGTLTVRGTSSTLNAGSTTLTVGGTATVDQAATLNAGSATISFAAQFTVGSSGGALSTLNAGTSTLNFNFSPVVPNGNSFLIYSPSVLNGGTARLNFGANTAATTRAFRMTGGTADMSTATVTFSGAGDFYPTGGTVTFGSGTVTMGGAMNIGGAAVNLGSLALTVSGATTVSSGSLSTGTGSVTFTGASTFSGGATTAGTGPLTFNGTFTASGGTFTGAAGNVTFNNAALVSGATVSGVSGALAFNGTYANSSGSFNMSAASSISVASTFTVSGGTTTFGSQVIGLPSLSVTAGTFNAGTANVTIAGTVAQSGGTATFASTTTGPTLMGALTITNGTFRFGSGTVNVAGAFTMSGVPAFFATASNLTFASTVSVSGGSFNCGSATIAFNSSASFSGTLPSTFSAFNGGTSNTTFKGPVTIGGGDGSPSQFHAQGATLSFEHPTTVMSPNSLLIQGAASLFDVSTASPFATLTFGKNTIAGTNAVNLSAGAMTINSATSTTFADQGEVVIASGTTLTTGSNAVTFPNTVTHAGTLTASSGALTFSRAHTIAGTLNGSTGPITFSQPLTVSGTFSGSSGARTFSSTVAVTGTFTASSGAHTFGGAITNNAGTFNLTNAASPLTLGFGLTIGGGTTTIGGQASATISSLTMSSGAFGVGNAVLTITGDTNITGGVATLSNTSRTVTFSGNLNVGPGTLNAGVGAATNRPVVVTGTTTVTANGVINAGASNTFRFNGNVVLGTMGGGSPGTFNAETSTSIFAAGTTIQGGSTLDVGAATSVTFSGAFSLTGASTFNGGTGSTTFTLSPTLTSGTFYVGTSGTTGRHTFSQNATFASGVTLAFPAVGGRLSLSATRVLTLQGPVTAATTSGATRPRIDCNGCTATQGISVAFASSSTLNIDGLDFYNSISTGVSIASGATYTLLKNLGFRSNAANGGAGTHLSMTLGTATILVPGCYFDTTTTTNVTLNGTAGQVRGARAVFEYQSVATNGSGAGESLDADGDNSPGDANPANNYGENVAAPYYGSVVQWSAASPTDTAGTAEGFPTAAFDWNTFAYYGVYVGYKNIGGAGTADRIWLRNADGTAGYYFDVPDSSGDIIGSPYWETSNEVTLGLDVNGDGDSTDTSVHVVYVPTSGGHIIKLIDSGTSLARPASGVWATDFTDSNVASISSPLISDATNLYFGGADSTNTKIFGVQITAAGGLEKTLVKNIGSVGAVTAAMSWKRITGVVYLYVGSRATLGQAYIYRINVSPGAVVEASYAGVTSNVNGSVRLANNRAFAVTDGGQLHALDATNFNIGGFVNVTGFPYQTAAAQPIQRPATIHTTSGLAYFGDDSGRLYAVTSAGANSTGYPFVVTSAAITSSPLYVDGSGVVVMGAADGYVYFIDRHNASGNPALFNRYYVGTGSVSSVAYNGSNAQYMVSSSDGKLSFVAASSVPDPTSANE